MLSERGAFRFNSEKTQMGNNRSASNRFLFDCMLKKIIIM